MNAEGVCGVDLWLDAAIAALERGNDDQFNYTLRRVREEGGEGAADYVRDAALQYIKEGEIDDTKREVHNNRQTGDGNTGVERPVREGSDSEGGPTLRGVSAEESGQVLPGELSDTYVALGWCLSRLWSDKGLRQQLDKHHPGTSDWILKCRKDYERG